MTTVISSADVRRLVPMSAAIDAVRDAFRGLSNGDFVLPVRTAFGDGNVLVMPAYHSETQSASVKVVQVDRRRAPAITGTLLWTDRYGELAIDGEDLTAIRTGAVVGVAVDRFAPLDAQHLVIIGAGKQAFDQVRAVLAVRPITAVSVIGRTAGRSNEFCCRIANEFPGVDVRLATDPAACLSMADVVSCATSSSVPVFDAADLPDNVLVTGVGSYTRSMVEIPPEAFIGADVVVDKIDAASQESGELIAALDRGFVDLEAITELGPRLKSDQLMAPCAVFKSVGLAIQDWAVALQVVTAVRATSKTT